MADDYIVTVPHRLTAELIDAVRKDPLCVVDDKDEMNKRIGWLMCAWDAIIERRTTPNAELT